MGSGHADGHARRQPSSGSGLEVSPAHLLEDAYVYRLIGDDLLQAGVLALQFLQALHRIGLHAAILVAPAVEGSLADAESSGNLGNRNPSGQLGLRLA